MNGLSNSVRLIGRLGANPETKELDGGKKVSRFTLATNETYKNSKGEKVKDTVWHNLVLWGKTASVAEKYLEKGNQVAIEGRIMNRSYTNKEGEKKFFTEIVVNELLMLDGKKN
jgi:single-strand DNA-binding protein